MKFAVTPDFVKQNPIIGSIFVGKNMILTMVKSNSSQSVISPKENYIVRTINQPMSQYTNINITKKT